MNKLIYRKLASDILSFFIVASLCITLIVWVIQAVNFLDIVSEDGHSLKIYFSYDQKRSDLRHDHQTLKLNFEKYCPKS